MDKEKDCDYDSDQSDEDFCPDKDTGAAESDAVSEEETDDDIDSAEEEATQAPKKFVKGKNGLPTKGTQRKRPTKKAETSDDDDLSEEPAVDSNKRRSTRQRERTAVHAKSSVHEKTELASDGEEKSRSDALWADFLGDAKPTKATAKADTSATKKNGVSQDAASKAEDKSEAPKTITVTEVVDFAGEEVRVQKTVAADSIKENKACTPRTPAARGLLGVAAGLKRPGGFGSAGSSGSSSGGGVGSILNQLGKKKKISVLEKSQLDWNSFKQDEGIDEQLQTFNKGKDGYLERQDFLQRTDLRQFEIEKNLRQTRRNH